MAVNPDEKFQRMLLDSATVDRPPRPTEEAWAQFESSVRVVTANIGSASGVHRLELPNPDSATAAKTAAAVSAGTMRAKALGFMLVGAIGGSALTASVTTRDQPARHSQQAAVIASAASQPSALAPAVAEHAEHAQPPAAKAEQGASEPSEPPPSTVPRSNGEPLEPVDPLEHQEKLESAASFTLAAEVELLDRARAASSPREAVLIIESYQREFPEGTLAPDAEVIAIEALARLGAGAELRQRASRFLERYPMDPHANRVQRLLHR